VPVESGLYELLGVSPDASEGIEPASFCHEQKVDTQSTVEIKKAYRKKVLGFMSEPRF